MVVISNNKSHTKDYKSSKTKNLSPQKKDSLVKTRSSPTKTSPNTTKNTLLSNNNSKESNKIHSKEPNKIHSKESNNTNSKEHNKIHSKESNNTYSKESNKSNSKDSKSLDGQSNHSLTNKLEDEIKELKKQLDEQKKEYASEISSLKKKIFILHNDKSKLSKNVEINEVKKVDYKLKNTEKIKHDLSKSQHKNDVIKKLLDESRENISNLETNIDSLEKDKEKLISIIEDYNNLGFLGSIRGKKPDSYHDFFKPE